MKLEWEVARDLTMKGGIVMSKTKMTSKAAARIQSATAKSNCGKTPKGSFSSRAQKSAPKSSKK